MATMTGAQINDRYGEELKARGSEAVEKLLKSEAERVPLVDHCMQIISESCKQISYAKICVEIDTSSALPDSFDLTLPFGAVFNIRVWYPWRLLRCESCKVFGRKTCQSKAIPMNSKPQVWVVKPTHVAPIVAGVLSPIVNDVVGVAASASPVFISIVAGRAVERIPTVVDIKKKAGIDGAASLKNLDSGEDKPDSGVEPITLPIDEEFADGLNQELILQVSPSKRREGSHCAQLGANLATKLTTMLHAFDPYIDGNTLLTLATVANQLVRQGHINPGLQYAKRLTKMGVEVTYATAFSALNRMTKSAATPPGLTFFGFSDGHDGGWDMDNVDHQMEELKRRGSEAVAKLIISQAEKGKPFMHVVYTTLIPWAGQVAHDLHVPSTFLWIQPATILDIYYYYLNGYGDSIGKNMNDPSWSVELPGLPPVTGSDLPSVLLASNTYNFALPLLKQHFDMLDAQNNPKVLVNSFDALESEALRAIEKLNLVAIGPLIPSAFLGGKDPHFLASDMQLETCIWTIKTPHDGVREMDEVVYLIDRGRSSDKNLKTFVDEVKANKVE
ncbi:hypothetical protein RHSIM_RhsimUnG0244800 [Rhododendron simsii]|uniref:Uncharacterized protein n=1 Tax=Rhododendron simsii TaxID=118357 RepID=A0A834FTW4_RHOSS|nr:hypothetical protein RHSIM_RhsimUnG0244800 [Rhododendron simsii]